MRAVMLMFDSLNRGMLAPYGCDWTKTPNFQRLASHSVRFEECYAGSLPCMPARRELQTGRYNFLHRSWGPMEPFDDSMPQLLKDAGVYTHLVSDHVHYWEDGGATYHYRYNSWEMIRGQEGDKWKCLPELFLPDEEACIQNQDGAYFYSARNLQRHDAVNRKFIKCQEETPLAQTFRAGMEFLEANHGCDSWFLQIECFDPHEPFFTLEERTEKGTDKEVEKDWPPYHHVTEDSGTIARYRKCYETLLEQCDRYLGMLLDQFDRLELWDDTMLIVNTDHGYLLGEHGWWSKVVMPCYDEIVHLPLFIHDPRFDCDGEARNAIVQTIDLAPTLLEYFGVAVPALMQGKPIRPVIEHEQSIRDYALFGIHGAHINLYDGRYVYMKAPKSEANTPLFEYTAMPMHMRSLFSVEELRKAEPVAGDVFSFTKGCPVWKVPKGNGNGARDFSDLLINGADSPEAKTIDNNSLVNAANFGDKLFDMKLDPGQETELLDEETEQRMANRLREILRSLECPEEQFVRIGLPMDRAVERADIQALHRWDEKERQPSILPEYQWTKGAVNTYRALLKFIPEAKRQEAVRVLEQEIPHSAVGGLVEAKTIVEQVPAVVPAEYVEMIRYFVDLSGRTA